VQSNRPWHELRLNPQSRETPSSIPFLALGSWILIVGWFGFNVMSAQRVDAISGLVGCNCTPNHCHK
jgi:ammonia channel protein AmtB